MHAEVGLSILCATDEIQTRQMLLMHLELQTQDMQDEVKKKTQRRAVAQHVPGRQLHP